MKSILLSIKPQYVAKILNGEKTIEIRKHAIPVGTKVYMYCTKDKSKELLKMKGNRYVICNEVKWWEEENPNDIYDKLNGKVVASFVVSKCEKIKNVFGMPYLTTSKLMEEVCVSKINLHKYANGKDLFAWHISQLKIFDRPKELKEFAHYPNCKKCTGDGNDSCCYCDWRYQITKAPQSYCYVEEIE